MDKDKRNFKQFGFFLIPKEERMPGDLDSDASDFFEQYLMTAIKMIPSDVRLKRGEIGTISDVKNIPRRRARALIEGLRLDTEIRILREEARMSAQKVSKV